MSFPENLFAGIPFILNYNKPFFVGFRLIIYADIVWWVSYTESTQRTVVLEVSDFK